MGTERSWIAANRASTATGTVVELRTEVFEKGPGGLFWRWVPAYGVPSRHVHAVSDGQLAAAFALHGPRVAGLLETCSEMMWRITAHVTGTPDDVVGQWYWQRFEETDRWIPNSEPWVVLEDRARLAALRRARRLADQLDQDAA
ncbi:hypothetical protein [Streptomyces sp. NPDC090025]|uniref:hypothetical protein n=1 Tax=Streptomyces sp. NPDC090025 TaxID=3365922 RepID=UPI00383968BB